ncbi:MAG TPA: type II toxin-antitoxin system VapC family toxin [Kiritimatiellia bacterium]|mgnify:CR=1 FL=1|jgi:PIN domain nuclease of toxin-antitoxin system|nr:type II toxin-antitoxin system VapC family toxin [Kiritimatiellia bacterium]
MIVLDTHAWLWWLHDPARLSVRARQAIVRAERDDGMKVSVISVWEVATKCALGKLTLPMRIDVWFEHARSYPGIVIEPVVAEDALASACLPGTFHKDPADRLIVALARRLQVGLVTADRLIRLYPHVETIW